MHYHHILRFTASLLCLALAGLLVFNGPESNVVSEHKSYVSGAAGAMEWVNSMRADPTTGIIDLGAFYSAFEQVKEFSGNARGGLNLQWNELGPDNIGGRTRAFLIDKDDGNKLFAGGVAGGLWVATNGGSSWSKVNGIDENIAVASICQAANGDIYVGTGEGLYFNFGYGAGGGTRLWHL